jgi:hypothetical protein
MKPEDEHKGLLAQLTGGNEERAEAAARELAEIGAPVVPELERLLESVDPDHRWWAIRTRPQMNEPQIPRLAAALKDSSGEVRAAAALGLASHPAEEAAPGLADALQDEDSIVTLLAVNALIAIGKAATPVLLAAYPKFHQRARIQCMRALADIRDHRAIPLMMKAIEEESALLRFWAEEGLNRLGLDMVYIKPE